MGWPAVRERAAWDHNAWDHRSVLRRLLRKAADGMPVRDPELTVREVRRRAAVVLPGVRGRRLVFWRYLLVWRKPA